MVSIPYRYGTASANAKSKKKKRKPKWCQFLIGTVQPLKKIAV